MYVPSLYEVSYKEDGTIASFVPTREGPAKITKEIVMDLDHAPYPEKPVVPFIRATQDRVVLEIQRGCIRGCRFSVRLGSCIARCAKRALRHSNIMRRRCWKVPVSKKFPELLEFQRLFPSGRAGRLPDDDLSGEKSEHFPAFSAN